MNNQITVFDNAEFGKLRTVETDKGIYFVGKDVANMLGYKNTRIALADNVNAKDKVVTKVTTYGGAQDTVCINESGVYALILGSKLPKAQAIKHWVTVDALCTLADSYKADKVIKSFRWNNRAKAILDTGYSLAQQRFTMLETENQSRISMAV